jgi:hypothetical protein
MGNGPFKGPFDVWICDWTDDVYYDRYLTLYRVVPPEWIWRMGGSVHGPVKQQER